MKDVCLKMAKSYAKVKVMQTAVQNKGIRILWWKRAYIPPFSNFLISVEKSTP